MVRTLLTEKMSEGEARRFLSVNKGQSRGCIIYFKAFAHIYIETIKIVYIETSVRRLIFEQLR